MSIRDDNFPGQEQTITPSDVINWVTAFRIQHYNMNERRDFAGARAVELLFQSMWDSDGGQNSRPWYQLLGIPKGARDYVLHGTGPFQDIHDFLRSHPRVWIDRAWGLYPVGTKAHSQSGGYWARTETGWRALSGDEFPTPGADAVGVCVELPKMQTKTCAKCSTKYERVAPEGRGVGKSISPADYCFRCRAEHVHATQGIKQPYIVRCGACTLHFSVPEMTRDDHLLQCPSCGNQGAQPFFHGTDVVSPDTPPRQSYIKWLTYLADEGGVVRIPVFDRVCYAAGKINGADARAFLKGKGFIAADELNTIRLTQKGRELLKK